MTCLFPKRSENDNRLYGLSGLKVIAMCLIFLWHSDMEKPPVDLGARACEFFFVAAGFLYAYAHHSRPVPCTAEGVFTYVKRKVASIWPIHFLCMLLTLLYLPAAQWLCRDGALMAALNLSLIHSFINNPAVYHAFNGVSWFASTIVVCYALAPLAGRMMRDGRKAFLFLPGAFAARFMIEWVQTVKPGAFWNVSIHVSPVVRMLEFTMGMAAGVLFLMLRLRTAKAASAPLMTALEAGALAVTAALFYAKQQTWLRAMFIPVFCLLVFVFAFDAGLVSRLFSMRPVQFFSSLQLEFFMLHQVMFRLIQRFYPTLYAYPKREFLVCFLLTTLFVLLYKRFVKKPFSALVDRALSAAGHFLAL